MSTNEMIGLVVTALGAIVGIAIAIGTPIMKAVKVMAELNQSVKTLTEKFKNFEINNHDDHKRIWQHNDKQDELIQEHSERILLLEDKVERNV